MLLSVGSHKGEKPDERAELQQVDEGVFQPVDGVLDVGFALPASSVTLLSSWYLAETRSS